MTETDDWRTKTRDAVKTLTKPELSHHTFEAFSAFLQLKEIQHQTLENSCASHFCSLLVNLSFIPLSMNYLKEVRSEMYQTVILDLLEKLTKSSSEICENFIKSDLHIYIVSNLQENPDFQKTYLDRKPKQNGAHEIMGYFLGILHNIVRSCKAFRSNLKDLKVKYALNNLLDVEDVFISSKALLILTFVVDVNNEKDRKLLLAKKMNLEFLIKHVLQFTDQIRTIEFETDSVKIQTDAKFAALGSEDILEPMSVLAANSENCRELVKQGIVSICEKVLFEAMATGFCAKYSSSINSTTKWSLVILHRLNKNAFLNPLLNFEDLIAKFKQHPIDDIAEIADGLLTSSEPVSEKDCCKNEYFSKYSLKEPKKQTRNQQRMGAERSDKHFMISYCHKQQGVAQKLKNELLKNGIYNIWIDYDHMHRGEGLLENMANAIDGSIGVLCCLSADYSCSKNCMLELRYAWNKNKTIIPIKVDQNFEPDKVILLCIGDSFRFDFSTDDCFSHNFPSLLQKLHITQSKK